MHLHSLLIASAVAVMAAPVSAAAPGRNVDDYVCAFSGKCGDEAAVDQAKDAPETKGFSLGVKRSPTGPAVAAPETKAFSLGTKATTTKAPARPVRPSAVPTRPVRAASVAGSTRRAAPVVPGKRMDLQLSFNYNSADLTEQARNEARVFAEALKRPELAGKRFLIAGHTDAAGTRAVNLDLSQRRAAAVAEYLAAQGVDRARLDVKGYGPDRPLPGKRGADPANRRVEAQLL